MRIKAQIEPAEAITAAIFNKVSGPSAEPVESYQELKNDEAPPAELKEWKAIQKAIERMPADAIVALSDLLKAAETASQQGCVRGLVRGARIAYQRWQNEQARDLLIAADITSPGALEASGADLVDIQECRTLFKDWSPSQRDVWAATRRNLPTLARSMMSPGPYAAVQQNAE